MKRDEKRKMYIVVKLHKLQQTLNLWIISKGWKVGDDDDDDDLEHQLLWTSLLSSKNVWSSDIDVDSV